MEAVSGLSVDIQRELSNLLLELGMYPKFGCNMDPESSALFMKPTELNERLSTFGNIDYTTERILSALLQLRHAAQTVIPEIQKQRVQHAQAYALRYAGSGTPPSHITADPAFEPAA